MTNLSAFTLCSVNINEGQQDVPMLWKRLQWHTVSFAVIHSITNKTLCPCFCFDGNKLSLIIPFFPPSHPSQIFYFILFYFIKFFFLFVCTHRMLARLLDQAFRRIGHPSQGQHAQLVSILHHLCSDSDPVDQVWNMDS